MEIGSWSLGFEAVQAEGVSLAVHPWVSESAIGSLELAVPIFLKKAFLNDNIAAVYRLVVLVLRLNENISLFFEGVNNKLWQIAIHVLNFLIESAFDVKLLFAILPSHNANP